jgi:hypothetical protein
VRDGEPEKRVIAGVSTHYLPHYPSGYEIYVP